MPSQKHATVCQCIVSFLISGEAERHHGHDTFARKRRTNLFRTIFVPFSQISSLHHVVVCDVSGKVVITV